MEWHLFAEFILQNITTLFTGILLNSHSVFSFPELPKQHTTSVCAKSPEKYATKICK